MPCIRCGNELNGTISLAPKAFVNKITNNILRLPNLDESYPYPTLVRISNEFWRQCCSSCRNKISGIFRETLLPTDTAINRFRALLTQERMRTTTQPLQPAQMGVQTSPQVLPELIPSRRVLPEVTPTIPEVEDVSPDVEIVSICLDPSISPAVRHQILDAIRNPDRISHLSDTRAKQVLSRASPAWLMGDAPRLRSMIKTQLPILTSKYNTNTADTRAPNYEGICLIFCCIWGLLNGSKASGSDMKLSFYRTRTTRVLPEPVILPLSEPDSKLRAKKWFAALQEEGLLPPGAEDDSFLWTFENIFGSNAELVGIWYATFSNLGATMWNVVHHYKNAVTRLIIMGTSYDQHHAVAFRINFHDMRTQYARFSLTYVDPNSPNGEQKRSYPINAPISELDAFFTAYNSFGSGFAADNDVTLFLFNPRTPVGIFHAELPITLPDQKKFLFSLVSKGENGRYLEVFNEVIKTSAQQRELLFAKNLRDQNISRIAAINDHANIISEIEKLPSGLESILDTDSRGLNALHMAAQSMRTKTLAKLATLPSAQKLFASMSSKDQTFLHTAAQEGNGNVFVALGHLPFVRSFFEAKTTGGSSPLHIAAQEGHANVFLAVGRLPFARELFDARSGSGNTPLHIAAHAGHATVFRAIYEMHMFDLLRTPDTAGLGDTPVHIAAREGNAEIIKEICTWENACALLEMPNRSRNTPITAAVREGHINVIREIANAPSTRHLLSNPAVLRTAKDIVDATSKQNMLATLSEFGIN